MFSFSEFLLTNECDIYFCAILFKNLIYVRNIVLISLVTPQFSFVLLVLLRKRRGGLLWKLLGLSIATAGGVVGYAWYDKEFEKTIEENVPYSKEALTYVFQHLPESLPYFSSQPSVTENKQYVVQIVVI